MTSGCSYPEYQSRREQLNINIWGDCPWTRRGQKVVCFKQNPWKSRDNPGIELLMCFGVQWVLFAFEPTPKQGIL